MRWTVAVALFSILISCSPKKPDAVPGEDSQPALQPIHQVIYYTLEPG